MRRSVPALLAFTLLTRSPAVIRAQGTQPAVSAGAEAQAATLQKLSDALTRTETQMQQLQQQVSSLKAEISALKGQLAVTPPSSAAPLDRVQEQLELQAAEIATQEQAKVETASKLPVRVSGLVLLNGFVNTRAADNPAVPSLVLSGSGATGLSFRQTVLGLEIRGPHALGASIHADAAVDFFGQALQGSYANTGGLLRLRTAHATLEWQNTRAFVELDRPLLNPYSPTSLTAVALPPLAWSGNLWNWLPQLGVGHDLRMGADHRLRLQAALLDVPDAPLFDLSTTAPSLNASLAESSRYPAVETRVALVDADEHRGFAFGLGGFFSPHQTPAGRTFDAWAATADLRWFLPARLVLSGNVYRGQALGGLGAGTYKDYLYRTSPNGIQVQGLNDVGGWFQLKERWSERLEVNAAFGSDNAFAGQLRTYDALSEAAQYQQLARNRAFFTNVIYSPSAYLSFSAEYRHLLSSPVSSPTITGDVYGVAAGFKF